MEDLPISLQRLTIKSLGICLVLIPTLIQLYGFLGAWGGQLGMTSSQQYLGGVDFLIDARKWNMGKVIYAFGLPMIIYTALSIGFLAFYLVIVRYRFPQLAWWAVWGATLVPMLLFSTIIAGILSKKYGYFAFLYGNYFLDIKDKPYTYIYLLPAIVGLVITSISCRRPLLELSPSVELLMQRGNRLFLFYVLWLPVVIGYGLFALTHIQDFSQYEEVLGVVLVLSVSISTISSGQLQSILIKKYTAESYAWLYLAIGLVSLGLVYWIFSEGITWLFVP